MTTTPAKVEPHASTETLLAMARLVHESEPRDCGGGYLVCALAAEVERLWARVAEQEAHERAHWEECEAEINSLAQQLAEAQEV